jgi:SsrA-binding protein
MKLINKKAYFNYQVLEDFTCGIVLVGSEVKSLRLNNVNFGDSFAFFKDGEIFLKNLSIAKYKEATYQNHDELRERKLLLTKKEITKISKLSETKGITLIPLEIFTLHGRFKIKLGVCRGKKEHDKRQSIKDRDIKRELKRKEF